MYDCSLYCYSYIFNHLFVVSRGTVMSEATTSTVLTHLDNIRTDGDTQARVELNQFVIDSYALAMEKGDTFPPITLFCDGSDYWLADGFHRVEAAAQVGIDRLDAEVRDGDRRDALLYACGANAKHGVLRSNRDKRHAVEILLADEKWGEWSDREIARCCGVSNRLVSTLRHELSVNGSQIAERVVRRSGITYTINTRNIGASQRIAPEVRNLIRDTTSYCQKLCMG